MIDFKTFESRYPGTLEALLRDWTTGGNIMWMTEHPAAGDTEDMPGAGDTPGDHSGEFLVQGDLTPDKGPRPTDQITVDDLLSGRIVPRNSKSREAQKSRTAYAAEVFTPPFACAEQNDLADRCWRYPTAVSPAPLRDGWIFTKVLPDRTWLTASDGRLREIFSEDELWMKYIMSNRMESCCGEGPYMCSPYDTTTGEEIPLDRRIGIFDRKMRLVRLFCTDATQWPAMSIQALRHCYAYEWQGDNLILARMNMLSSWYEYMLERFPMAEHSESTIKAVTAAADVISKNMVQMDGMSWCIPLSCSKSCCGCRDNEPRRHDGRYVRTYWWVDDRWEYFRDYAKSSGAQDVYELF